MRQLKVSAVVPAARLRLTTINDQGISWPSTIYSGHVVLDRDPTVPDGVDLDATEPLSFVIPDALAASRPPKHAPLIELSVRAVRGRTEPGPFHLGAYDASLTFVPDPSGGDNLWPELTFHTASTGVEHIELNYRVVVEDS
jgi:hypothetical protein